MLDTSNLETNIQNFFSNGKDEKRIWIPQENGDIYISTAIYTYIYNEYIYTLKFVIYRLVEG